MAKIETIGGVREELIEAIERVKKDRSWVPQMHEVANACGKIIASAKLELEYAQARKERPEIAFLRG